MATSGETHERPLPLLALTLIAILIGFLAALGAVAFRGMIAFFHNLFFLGRLSLSYDALGHTAAGPWGAGIILIPALGALGVAFLVKTFAPEAKGTGVPEIMDTIHYRRGIVRPVVAVVKTLASSLSLGSGGSIGREGPIIQIGASFGSTVGQLARLPLWQRNALISAGAGGGIAATFNTPVGGILFTVEILMQEFSARTLIPVALAVAAATFLGRIFFGGQAIFAAPPGLPGAADLGDPSLLLAFVGLGVLVGLGATLFIRSIYACEDFFERRIGGSYYTRHALGMLGVGAAMYALMRVHGHYYIEGVGYATIQDALAGRLDAVHLLVLLGALKLLAVSLTLGSGASGGIFSPALYLGAMLGTAYALLLGRFAPGLAGAVPFFTAAAMAGTVAAATGAAVASIVMILEMTASYSALLPLILTVACGYLVRLRLCHESTYTMKLVRRGHPVPTALLANSRLVRRAVVTLPVSRSVAELAHLALRRPDVPYFVLTTEPEGSIAGVVARDGALAACEPGGGRASVAGLPGCGFIVVSVSDPLYEVAIRMNAADAAVALVLEPDRAPAAGQLRGLITRSEIAATMTEDIASFAE
jgi:CIC family chloride channel protein